MKKTKRHTSIISEDALLLGHPVPHHDAAVFGACDDVAVLRDRTLRPRHTSHHIKMAVQDLRYFAWWVIAI